MVVVNHREELKSVIDDIELSTASRYIHYILSLLQNSQEESAREAGKIYKFDGKMLK